MPVVIISKYIYVDNNKEALKLAKRARMEGKRSEIISDPEYANRRLTLVQMQDLSVWARNNPESSS